jgi:hypothetical protein
LLSNAELPSNRPGGLTGGVLWQNLHQRCLDRKVHSSAGADSVKKLGNTETMQEPVQPAQPHHKIIFNTISQLRDNGHDDGMQEKQHQN